jgi:hypothetical protein
MSLASLPDVPKGTGGQDASEDVSGNASTLERLPRLQVLVFDLDSSKLQYLEFGRNYRVDVPGLEADDPEENLARCGIR